MDYRRLITDVPNWPQPGVLFRDISPLLRNPECLTRAAKDMTAFVRRVPIDKVVAIESRGFIFGALLAHMLNAGFVMVRKQHKLPPPAEGSLLRVDYSLEYGNAVLEMAPGSIDKGENILIHDDVLATGGTAEATARLVENAGGNVLAMAFLVELTNLNGRGRIDQYPIHSLIPIA
jgi:adenine phosphoribosyltransferase